MGNRTRLRRAALAAALFAALAVLHTWPLARDPARLSRNDNFDTQLNEWIVAWIAHRLPRDPQRLFDANIFHPEPRTLAFSEPLLVPALVGAPLAWLGASPVLGYNALLLLGLATTGLAGYAAGAGLTGDRLAGVLCGVLVAFNAQTLSRLPHLQAQHAQWLPLALLLLDRLLARPRTRDALALGACAALLALTSGYWAALVAVALAAALAARADEWWGRRAAPLLARLAAGAALAAALAVPPLLPYALVHEEQGLERSLEEAEAFAATPEAYLATPARLHHATWSRPFYLRTAPRYFPGVVALALAAGAVAGRGALRRPRLRGWLMVGLGGFLLSLGPHTPLWEALRRLFPPARGLRDPSRFGHLVLIALALLAAEGLVRLRRRLGARRGTVAALALAAVANLEALVAPVDYARFDGLSPVYGAVAGLEEPVVLAELPFYAVAEVHRNAPYVLGSTAHWRPLLNGYSGFTPASYARRARVLRDFPEPPALAELRRSGVTHVIVHFARFHPPRAARLAAWLDGREDFHALFRGPDGETLYRLDHRPDAGAP